MNQGRRSRHPAASAVGRACIRLAGLGSMLAMLIAACPAAHASSYRLWLASQQDWGAKRGFYLDFENQAAGDAPSRLETLKIILGVGDGTGWRFSSTVPHWEYNHDYHARAVISTTGAQLFLDGQLLGSSPGGFAPSQSKLDLNLMPGWASGPAEYLVIQSSATLKPEGGKSLDVSFAREAARPLPLFLFSAQSPRSLTWKAASPLTIDATFHLAAAPGLAQLSPLIDRYGQCRYAQWPQKVQADANLKKSLQAEQQQLQRWGAPAGYDRYGGDTRAGWKDTATGFYHLARHQNAWWLISPDGNPVFYRGLCTTPALTWEQTPVTGREQIFEWLPPHSGPDAAAWGQNPWGQDPGIQYVAFRTANLVRKFGPDWEKQEDALTARRLQAWGFSGIGKWGGMDGVVSTPVLSRRDVPSLGRHPDVFDPAVQQQFRESLRKQIEPRRTDPLMLGWSLGNEYDEIITPDEIAGILKMPAQTPARRALLDYAFYTLYGSDIARIANAWKVTASSLDELNAATVQPPAEDIESLRRFYADRYYDFIYTTIRQIDPNHLYLGFWIVPGWWVNEEDWRLIARHCDVIGYDRYAPQFTDAQLARLMQEAAKPVLCGEFSFPPYYFGERGFGLYDASWVETEDDAGQAYGRWLADAARNPYCVGVSWFQYRDEPLTGRGPGHGPALVYGEHYAFGLVDEADQPKERLLSLVRGANLAVTRQRLAAANH